MANQNLSQFTEKTFVADADWTFVWDTVGAISKKVSRNNWLNSGTLATSAPVTISQTWDQAATLFTALKVDATNTSSLTTSRLLDLQAGGVTKFNVDRTGNINVDPTNSSAFLTFKVGAGTAFQYYGGSGWGSQPLTVMAAAGLSVSQGVLALGANTVLLRDGADNTLALRNGINPQTFNVYGTYTPSPLAYERLSISATGGVSGNAIIGTNKTGTGVLTRGLDFQTDGIRRGGFNASGNFDVVASIATTAAVYVGPSYNALASPSAGVFKISNLNENDFNRLQFGGTTASFPAIKRNSTTLQTRLADDSAFAPIQGKLTTDTAYTAGAITDTGYIVLYDSTGTAYKVACTPV